jgi:hypothetical protein
MGGHGELKLLAQAMRALPNSELLDFRPLANGSQVWDVSFGQGAARARSSFAAEIVL